MNLSRKYFGFSTIHQLPQNSISFISQSWMGRNAWRTMHLGFMLGSIGWVQIFYILQTNSRVISQYTGRDRICRDAHFGETFQNNSKLPIFNQTWGEDISQQIAIFIYLESRKWKQLKVSWKTRYLSFFVGHKMKIISSPLIIWINDHVVSRNNA